MRHFNGVTMSREEEIEEDSRDDGVESETEGTLSGDPSHMKFCCRGTVHIKRCTLFIAGIFTLWCGVCKFLRY